MSLKKSLLLTTGALAGAVGAFKVGRAYNHLAALEGRIGEAEAELSAQICRRHDLAMTMISLLAQVGAEEGTLSRAVGARHGAMAAEGQGPSARACAEDTFAAALRDLIALAIVAPEVIANKTFASLQEDLVSAERQISFARTRHNAAVQKYNHELTSLPTALFASRLGHYERELFA